MSSRFSYRVIDSTSGPMRACARLSPLYYIHTYIAVGGWAHKQTPARHPLAWSEGSAVEVERTCVRPIRMHAYVSRVLTSVPHAPFFIRVLPLPPGGVCHRPLTPPPLSERHAPLFARHGSLLTQATPSLWSTSCLFH